MFDLAATLFVITALLSYANYRFLKLPSTIGVMAIALMLSVLFVGLDMLGVPGLREYEAGLLGSFDFSHLLLQGMLSFLLFAGALHVDLTHLRKYRWQVGLLAVIGTVTSTVLIGVGTYYILSVSHYSLSLSYCLAFGALISPTDPIAVLSLMKTAGAPKSVEVVITGESLFNDGVGVVLFAVAVEMLGRSTHPNPLDTGVLLLRQAGGGLIWGSFLGAITYYLIRGIDNYQEEVLLTLAMVMGGYALADRLLISGPLAMVVAGLVVGNQGRAHAMSANTRERLDTFWDLIDSMLNSVLFVIIGFEFVMLRFPLGLLIFAALVLGLTLVVRMLTVSVPLVLFPESFGMTRGFWKLLTWGGLRGGISVALALSLEHGKERDLVVALTYLIVVFSILVQGLTFGPLIRRTVPCAPQRRIPRDTNSSLR